MAKAGGDYFVQKGLKTMRSKNREDTEAGRMAGAIIDLIPEGYDVYEDHDISEEHLAEAITEACGRYIRHCPQIGWMVYNPGEGRWTERYAEAAVQRVIVHFGQLLWEGAADTNPGETRFARHALSSAGISAVKKILMHGTRIAVEQDRFDANPDMLNCMGDAYNLRTGERRRAEPEDMFCKSTHCKAAALERDTSGGAVWKMPEFPPMFGDFMRKVTSKDGKERLDLLAWIMFYFGYSLTGDNGASFFVNFHGQGKNGKSALLNLMMELFGDYALPLPKDVVIENRFAGQFDMAGLPGVRLGVLVDAPDGRLNMDVLKPLVAGDAMNAKRKYQKDFTFKPACKIAVGSNPKLKLKDTGMAIRRRVRMVPFDYVVPDEEVVVNLHRRMLKEEGPQILALLIHFANRYYSEGEGPKAFPTCATVDEASREYVDSEDLVGRWMDERTEAAEGAAESADDLYKDFVKWEEDEGVRKKMSKNVFGEHLGSRVPEKKRVDSKHYYVGIKLKFPPKPAFDGGG